MLQCDMPFVAITEGRCPFVEERLLLVKVGTEWSEVYLLSGVRLGNLPLLEKLYIALDLELFKRERLIILRFYLRVGCFYILLNL